MKKIVVVLASLFIAMQSYGQNVKWIIMARSGGAYDFRTPLLIKQKEQEDIRFSAKYATEPFNPPPYCEFYVTRWNETKGWGLKITHHKLYLQNNPPEVQRFTITDGYNLISLTRQWKIGPFIYHLGGGAVMTHPESVIRNQKFNEKKGILHMGYYISGPLAETAIEKRIDLSRKFMLSFEGRLTGSYVKVPVANGHAYTSNVALHGLVGIGYKIYGK